MKRIFKYGVPPTDHFELVLPLNAEILTFHGADSERRIGVPLVRVK